MIRHRRTIVFSLPHVLWMLTALLFVVTNWLSLWDFHNLTPIPQATIAAGFGFSVLSYFFCALVSPDFIIASLILNFAAGSGMGIQKWSDENVVVLAMVVPAAAALWLRAAWVQAAAPSLMIAL